jgi:hypothetical protein
MRACDGTCRVYTMKQSSLTQLNSSCNHFTQTHTHTQHTYLEVVAERKLNVLELCVCECSWIIRIIMVFVCECVLRHVPPQARPPFYIHTYTHTPTTLTSKSIYSRRQQMCSRWNTPSFLRALRVPSFLRPPPNTT